MGEFRLPEPVVGSLTLDGPWAGAEVRTRLTVPLGVFFDVLEAVESAEPARLRPILRTWADAYLVGWNVCTADGTPVPATADGLEQGIGYLGAVAMLSAWLRAASEADLPGPLGLASPAGATSAA